MLVLLVVIALSVPMEAPFVDAEATAMRFDDTTVTLSVSVETSRGANAVLVRATGPDGGELDPVAMVGLGSEWRTTLVLPRRSDIRLSFEHLDAEGFSFLSRPISLIELGVDPAIFALTEPVGTADTDANVSGGGDRTRWAWLALGLSAAALALVIVAFSWGDPRAGSAVPDDDAEDASPPEEVDG